MLNFIAVTRQHDRRVFILNTRYIVAIHPSDNGCSIKLSKPYHNDDYYITVLESAIEIYEQRSSGFTKKVSI